MNATAIVVLALSLLAQRGGPPAREGGGREDGRREGGGREGARHAKADYQSAGPIHYGKHPSQVFCINYYPGGPPRPLMITISSGGWNSGPQDKPGDLPPKYQELGLASATVSHRSLHIARYPAQINDLMNAVRYIKNHAREWNIDPDRIGVTGRSSGGHLAMMVGFHPDSPKVACVVENSGPACFDPEFLRTINPHMVDTLGQYMKELFGEKYTKGSPAERAKLLRKFSPATYMTKDGPPTLFHANMVAGRGRDGEDPNRSVHSYLFAEDGYKRYKAVGGVAQLEISKTDDRDSADRVEQAFLRKYLIGERGRGGDRHDREDRREEGRGEHRGDGRDEGRPQERSR